MKASKPRILVGLLLSLALCCVALWWVTPMDPAVQISFLYATKDTGGIPGMLCGTFQVENRMKDPLTLRYVRLVLGKGQRYTNIRAMPMIVDWGRNGVTQTLPPFPASSTNCFQCLVPASGGPFRLGFPCYTERLDPVQNPSRVRNRLGVLAFYLVPPIGNGPKGLTIAMDRILCRIKGGTWVETPPFKPTPLDDSVLREITSGATTNIPGNNKLISRHIFRQ